MISLVPSVYMGIDVLFNHLVYSTNKHPRMFREPDGAV